MQTNTKRFPRPVLFTFAGLSFPHTLAVLAKGTPGSRLTANAYNGSTGPVYNPGNPDGKPTGHGTYLESDNCAGLRWTWADEVEGMNIDHTGWYSDDDGAGERMRGIVVRLNSGRGFLAGWSMGVGMATDIDTQEVYESERAAAYNADQIAERAAEKERDYQRDQARAEYEEEHAESVDVRYVVDGAVTENDPDGPEYQGDGAYPPFVVFDTQAQENLPGQYQTRQEAEAALAAVIAQGDEHLAEDCSLLARLLQASQDDNTKLKAAVAHELLTLRQLADSIGDIDYADYTLSLDRLDALAQGVTVRPVLGFDGFGLNDIDDKYRSRVFTMSGEYKPGGPKAEQGAALLAALFSTGVATRNY